MTTLGRTRIATTQHYLMCPPTYFAVDYSINPWMDLSQPVSPELAQRQWKDLHDLYGRLGHDVSLIPPIDGLPDMVFAANGALVIGELGYAANFTFPERIPEGPAYRDWLADQGIRMTQPSTVNEGAGDFRPVRDLVLAGCGFRTDRASHDEVSRLFGRTVFSLELIDPYFYHLDTALLVLDDDTVAFLPEAFSTESRTRLRELFPGAIEATTEDAALLGLNGVSDGSNVVLVKGTSTLADRVAELGYQVFEVDLSEFRKAGGGPKCCTLELQRAG